MIKCPCCLLDYKDGGSICSNCGYQLKEEEQKEIFEVQNKKYNLTKVLTIISIISFIIWMVIFCILFLPVSIGLQLLLPDEDSSNVLLAIVFVFAIGIVFYYVIAIIIAVGIVFIPHLVFFIINIKNSKSLSDYKINQKLSKKGRILFIINLIIFILVAISFMTIFLLFFIMWLNK